MISECVNQLHKKVGMPLPEASRVRNIAMILHRWYERECGSSDNYKSVYLVRGYMKNGEFEYDDDGDAYNEVHPYHGNTFYEKVPDREKGAHKNLEKIMKKYPDWGVFFQTDPRGAPLYLYKRADIGSRDIDCCYSSFGIAVYK